MDHWHLHRVRTLVLVAVVLTAATLMPRLVLLTLSIGAGLLVGAVLLGALALWAVKRRVRRLLLAQQAPSVPVRVIDGVLVEAR